MPGLGIRIEPPDILQPQIAAKPLENALRWESQHESAEIIPTVSVFLHRSAYIRVSVHACSASDEVGGVLVGEWRQEEESGEQYLVVKHALPARHTRQGSVYLTFTQDSLVDLHEQIDKRYQGERIIGWYHTHPRMGIFLSHYDTWLHSNFFPEPWQVALVVEPYSSLGGFFIRQRDGELDPHRYFGFYEADGANGGSIARWKNLSRVENGSERRSVL
ncbi:MAG: hypothetical protein JXA13_04570 [Anaerolineales bacterium]|nr:hypothetical protein [Anaerolineales bacterium]